MSDYQAYDEERDYNPEYISAIFKKNPALKKDLDKIKERLKSYSNSKDDNDIKLNISDVRELFNNLLKIFNDENSGKIITFDQLSEKQKQVFYLEIEKIAEEIAGGKQNILTQNNILTILINDQTEKYIKANDPGDFLTEKDKKQIRDELKRMAEFEIYKMLNPSRIAGETRVENFRNNMIIGGEKLAENFEGREYLDKLDKKDISGLDKLKEEFNQNYKIERKEGAQTLKNIGEGFERKK